MPDRRFDPFVLLAFVPAITFVVLLIYVRGYDGWGAWAAAPLLLVPPVVSLPIAWIGVRRVLAERTRGAIRGATVLLTLVAAVPLLWLGWRLVVTSLG
ncbi:MAG: hypothetical protein R3195_17800 [Gemmatimonadota bacterium]|nr:hypothetical protein [Gemmatimonadota bacterium]